MMEVGLGRLGGKTAFITGAASGIGRAVALAFVREGAAVALVDIDRGGLDSAATQIEALGGRCQRFCADVTADAELGRAIDRTIAELGQIDILVNNAGILLEKSLVDTTDEDWDRITAVNLRAPTLIAKLVARHMIAKGIRGRIINVTSTLAERPATNMAAYVALKGALRMTTRAMAQELAAHGIAVNAVGPGLTQTAMTAHLLDSPDKIKEQVENIPFGRIAVPEDVAEACLFLASADAEYMAGSSIYVDGGALL